ncbi:MAG TPA: hypothetical protein PKD90_19410, partial [Phnomibacter sp.]|nr:hypothetical protein [Phnomibacter sp.]
PTGLSGSYNAGTKVYTISGTPIGVGTFNYTVTANAADGACPNATATGSLVVSAIGPVLTGPITGPASVCPPATGLTYGVTGGIGVVKYEMEMPNAQWSISGATNGSSIAVNVSPTAPLTASQIRVRGINGCGTTAWVDYIINVDNFAGVNAGPDQTVCANQTVNLTAVLGGSASSVTWTTDGNGSFDNNTSLTPVYTPGAADISNGTVTLTATTNTPGGTCNVAGVDQIMIAIRPLPTASIAVTGGNPICSGSSTTLTMTGTPNTTVSYTINGGPNQTADLGAGGSASVSTSALTGNTSYQLVSVAYTSAPGCTVALSQTATVTVNQPAVVVAGSNGPICQSPTPTTITLSGSSVTGGASSGTWRRRARGPWTPR